MICRLKRKQTFLDSHRWTVFNWCVQEGSWIHFLSHLTKILYIWRRDYAIQNKQHNHENWECSFHSAKGNNSNPKSLWVLEENCWQLWLQVSRVLNASHNTITRRQEAESYFGLMLLFGSSFMWSKLIQTPEKVSKVTTRTADVSLRVCTTYWWKTKDQTQVSSWQAGCWWPESFSWKLKLDS